MNEHSNIDQDLECFHALLTLWQAENPIKTIKLQFLLATNAILLCTLHLGGGLAMDNTLLGIGGFALNLVWTLSIGRTSLFQKAWKNKLDDLARLHSNDARFQILNIKQAETQAATWLRLCGSVSSKYYLLGAPVTLSLIWLGISLSTNY